MSKLNGRFFALEVADVRKDTRDAVVLTLMPRAGQDASLFDFTQGQYLTFRREFDGVELRRSYSICAGKDDGVLRVGIKRVEGGVFSTWANEKLKPGDILEAMPPMGSFHTPVEPECAKHYLGFAVGSGITPVLSILKTVLSREPYSRFTLVYANRQISSIMFREELDDLKDRHLDRMSVIHILKAEAQDIPLLTGRIDAEKCATLFHQRIDLTQVHTAFICGPEPMTQTVRDSLRAHGMPEERIKFELFGTGQTRWAARRPAAAGAGAQAECEASVTLDGTTRVFRMDRNGQSLLDAALAHDIDAPYACKAGVCSTCRAKVLEGEVEMIVNHALEDYELAQGYVLTCQCHPLTDNVVIDFDH